MPDVEEAAVDDIPSENVSLQLRKQFGPRLFVQGRVGAYAIDDRPGPSEVRMPGYTLLDVSAGYRVNKNLDLRFLGRNLLDQSYYASPDPRWVWAPGASVLATVVVAYRAPRSPVLSSGPWAPLGTAPRNVEGPIEEDPSCVSAAARSCPFSSSAFRWLTPSRVPRRGPPSWQPRKRSRHRTSPRRRRGR